MRLCTKPCETTPIAELLDTNNQNVSPHLKNIFDASELPLSSVVKESLTTAADGNAAVAPRIDDAQSDNSSPS